MTPCAYCRGPADLFTPNGDVICQSCDSGFKARVMQSRADEQVALDPIGATLTFASPKTLFRVGLGLVAGSLALGLLEVFVVGQVHVMMLGMLFMAGAAALWRSL